MTITNCLLGGVLFAATLGTQSLAQSSRAPQTLPGGWVYEWGDEFNGSTLDLKKWKYELGVIRNPGTTHAYTKSCVQVRKGKLILHSKKQETKNSTYDPKNKAWWAQIKTQPYASGSVTTRGVKHFTYGRLEIRAKIPKMSPGVWPALWTMHVNDYPWPANGEIDILEAISQQPNTCYSIFRWGANGGTQEKKLIRTTRLKNYSKKYHLYVLEWDEQQMRILIDGKEVGKLQTSETDYPDGGNPLKTPCYLIMNTALGGKGTWPESTTGKGFPVQFEIDYVRYYVKKKK